MGLMNVAYCDESGNYRSPPVFLVSGYLGRGPDWYELGRRWRIGLQGEPFETKGFHMAKCEAGIEPPYRVSRDQRDYWQRKFIGIINDTPLWAYAVAVETEPYNALDQADAEVRARRGDYSGKPYYFAFQFVVERMAKVLEEGGFSKGECIAFIFDQQKEYEGKAKALYDELQASALGWVSRLGRLSFDSRLATVQLQAADILAYESMKHFREIRLQGKPSRWQFDLLKGVRKPRQFELAYFDRNALQKTAQRVGWIR